MNPVLDDSRLPRYAMAVFRMGSPGRCVEGGA
jgi:hypothetical protein